MTITKDHTGKRKPSWESKISVCTASTRPVGRSERSDTPSSILSSDSDIRFTRKLGGQYRCGCCIVAGFLLFLLVAAIAVYLAYTFILSKSTDERIFRVNFRIIEGDAFHSKLADPSTEEFRIQARNYRERLNLIFRRSPLRPAFIKTDILALDGTEGEDLIVHFNVHFDSRRMAVTIPDLIDVLSREINLEESLYLSNLTIPADSLVVRENIIDMTTHLPVSTVSTTLLPSTTQRPPRQCLPLQMSYCSNLPYNVTSYPNLMGHNSYSEVLDDVISFREIIDSECSRLAYDFVCHVLQPPCQKAQKGETEDTTIMPCRSYCNDFVKNCGNRIPERFKDAFECSKYPEISGNGQCVHRPGCVEELQSRGLEARLCDGVVDCPDLSDELSCSYCEEGFIHCGVGRNCIPKSKQCDGLVDCPNGSDENNCLSVLPSSTVPKSIKSTPHQHKYFDTGFVSYNTRGRVGKLCMDEYNDTNIIDVNETLREFASFMCKSASYEKVISYQIQEDEETDDVQYVEMVGDNVFLPAVCPRKNILHIGCENLECGIQDLNPNFGVQGLNKMANHGDWPWHVALLKDNVHLCDGTLMSDEWILTTASCFQGQTKAEWVARFGSVRLTSSSPWEQERRIIGMMKSPVEGSTLVLLKLNEPVAFSDFVRPVCLPDPKIDMSNFTYCTTLGWSKTREQLQRVDVKMSNMAMCENVSITTVNSVCTQSIFSGMDCNEEEFAGSPLLCQKPGARQWSLIGVTNWRIACQKQGIERPRLYDKTIPNIDWINQNILAS